MGHQHLGTLPRSKRWQDVVALINTGADVEAGRELDDLFAADLSFYENGITSFNFPVSEHVLGARASRTTHPRVLADCSKLFSLLADVPFQVQNPYVWKTKTQVVRTIVDQGARRTDREDRQLCAHSRADEE